jgi:hypothetical protein
MTRLLLSLALLSAISWITISNSLGGDPSNSQDAAADAKERPTMPEITSPVSFDTPDADKIVAALNPYRR